MVERHLEETENGSLTNETSTSDTEEPVSPSDGETLKTTLRLYGSIYLVAFVLFCVVRKCYPKAYNVRNWVPDLKCSLAEDSFGYISWTWKVFKVPEDDIQEQCGMDALCMLRIIYFGFRVTIVGILNAIWLMPIYATAPESDETAHINDRIVQVSATNVPSSNGRLICTTVAAYIVFGYSMYLILAEFQWYTAKRHHFLAKTRPRNYSVYVSGICQEYRSNAALLKYFRECFSDDAVLEAQVTLDVPSLRKMQSEREELIQKYEHAININRIKGSRPTIRKCCTSKKVDAINAYSEELETLNQKIKEEIEKIEAKNAKDDVACAPDTEEESNGDMQRNQERFSLIDHRQSSEQVEAIEAYTAELRSLKRKIKRGLNKIEAMGARDSPQIMPEIETSSWATSWWLDSSGAVKLEKSMEPLENPDAIESFTKELKSLKKKVNEGIERIEAIATENHRDSIEKIDILSTTDNWDSIRGEGSSNVDETEDPLLPKTASMVEETSGRRRNMFSSVTSVLGGDEGKPRDAGFVSFTKLRTTHAALQMIHHHTAFEMDAVEAPNPHDIFWPNIGRSHRELQVGKFLGFTLTALVCLFWTIPVAFATSMASVDSLKELLPFLKPVLEAAPILEVILAQIAPLFVYILNEILPMILMKFAEMEGPISSSVLETSLFVKYASFMIIQTFFVSAISGSVFRELDAILDNPQSGITLLANALPEQAIYFVQILLVSTFIGQSMELLRVKAMAVAWIRRYIAGPNLTEKERNTTYMCFHPLADPIEYEYGVEFGEAILFFMVTFVYSTLAPITNFFLAFCFVLLGYGYRNQFIYIYPPSRDSGGKLWTGFISIAITCMIVAEFVLMGWLGIKKAPIAAGLMFPLIIANFCFSIYIRQKHFYVTNHLPTPDCLQLDRENRKDGPMDLSFLRNAYLQPSLKEKELYPEPDIWQGMHISDMDAEASSLSVPEGYETNPERDLANHRSMSDSTL